MDRFKAKGNRQTGPEAKVQTDIIKALRGGEWLVKVTIGNEFQSGFPDLYCAHRLYGQRWIEVKYAEAYRFTNAQLEFFPQLAAVGVGVWVLCSAEPEELNKLFKPPNWWAYTSVAKV